MLLLIILAQRAGEDQPQAMADWARWRQSEWVELLPLERETLPSAHTYRQVVGAAVEPEALQRVISEFLQAQAQAGLSVLICMDGQTLRGTLNAASPSGVHRLAAYLPGEGLVLLPLAVDAQTNEITVAPRLLKSLD